MAQHDSVRYEVLNVDGEGFNSGLVVGGALVVVGVVLGRLAAHYLSQ